MLADFAAYLWSFLWGLFHSLGQLISDTFGRFFGFLGNLFSNLFDFLSGLVQNALNALADFLQRLFQPVLDLIAAIFHLVEKLWQLLGLLFQLFISLGHLIVAFIQGLFSTLAGLSYSGQTPSGLDSNVMQASSAVTGVFSILQLDTIAYLCLFGVWIATAVMVVRMIGSFGGGSR